MTVETAEDRRAFVSADEFGVTAQYSQNGAPAVTIAGIFDSDHLMIDAGQAGVTSSAPVFTCTADDLAGLVIGRARAGDLLTIAGVTYAVTEPRPDGTGMVSLILEKQ